MHSFRKLLGDCGPVYTLHSAHPIEMAACFGLQFCIGLEAVY